MKNFNIALQLYSVRDEMERDVSATLKKVKEIGYDYVEFAGYFGHTADEVRSMLEENGLKCLSVHQTPELFLEKGQEAIDYLKTIGAKYCAIPWYDVAKLKGTDQWEKTVADFTAVGKALKENGIQLLYHNHDFEFGKYEDKFLLDWIFETVPAQYLQPQIDTCWVKYAGNDPAAYVMQYKGRVDVVHLKDFVCKNLGGAGAYALIDADGKESKKPTREENGFEFRPVGHGMQNFDEILTACENAGTNYVVVEQDQSPERPTLEAAKLSLEFLLKKS